MVDYYVIKPFVHKLILFALTCLLSFVAQTADAYGQLACPRADVIREQIFVSLDDRASDIIEDDGTLKSLLLSPHETDDYLQRLELYIRVSAKCLAQHMSDYQANFDASGRHNTTALLAVQRFHHSSILYAESILTAILEQSSINSLARLKYHENSQYNLRHLETITAALASSLSAIYLSVEPHSTLESFALFSTSALLGTFSAWNYRDLSRAHSAASEEYFATYSQLSNMRIHQPYVHELMNEGVFNGTFNELDTVFSRLICEANLQPL
jgi:hypothetical protein